MKKRFLFLSASLCGCSLLAQGLREVYGQDFRMGVALNQSMMPPADPAVEMLIVSNFNAIVAENAMKAEALQPREGEFHFENADRLVAFGEKHGMKIIGHTLVWHSQAPRWFFKNQDGTPVTRETLLARMRGHIRAVVGHYRGRVSGWDVVNEAFESDGSLRKSPYALIIGEDFIEQAFRCVQETDPWTECYYNDYGMDSKGKRERVVRLVRDLRAKGIRIDAVGMQTHVSLAHPDLADYEASVNAFAAAGVRVMVTEMDISVLPWVGGAPTADIAKRADYEAKFDPYRKGLPVEIEERLTARYVQFFTLFHHHRQAISRVTLWGLSDADSWLNQFPVHGRMDYPLLFDRALKPKLCLKAILRIPAKEERGDCHERAALSLSK